MAFKRKHRDKPVKVRSYKYRIFPENQQNDFSPEIKDAIFTEVRLMNNLWNRLVELRKSTLNEYEKIYNEEFENAGLSTERKPSAKEMREISPVFCLRITELWQSYEQTIKDIDAEPELRAKLAWDVRESIINNFKYSHQKALKNGGEIKLRPQFIRQFYLPHRFSGGGLSPSSLNGKRATKAFIEHVPDQFYADNKYRNRINRVASGRYKIKMDNSVRIPFRIVYNRRIPASAKIRRSILTGKLKNNNWEYHLIFVVDEIVNENEEARRAETIVKNHKPVAGLDLGWRKFDDYIRFGMLADSNGNVFEFRLPHDPGKQQGLRRLEKLLAKHGQMLPEFPRTWQDIEDWQTKNDFEIEQIKIALRSLSLPEIDSIKPIIDNLVKVRKTGLLRLLRSLLDISNDETLKQTYPQVLTGIEILEKWKEELFSREKKISYARDRLINNRNYNYQLLSLWIKDNYQNVALDGDFNLQRISSKTAKLSLLEEDAPALKNSAKFRVRVALNELKSWLRQRESDDETWLVPVKDAIVAKNIICLVCGAPCEPAKTLHIICNNGHEQDQDVQAAVNIMNRIKSNPDSASKKEIVIPVKLKNVIVRLK